MTKEIKKESRLKKLAVPLVFLAASVVGVSALATSAVFTDSAVVGANTLTAGTVDLAATPASAAISASGIAPGDTIAREITVANSGSLAYRYSITGSVNTALGLQFTVKTGVTSCTDANYGASGTVVSGPVTLTTSTSNLMGNPSTGSHTGDRTVNAGANEKLCVVATLPLSATTQGTSVATFNFAAEQTQNN